MTMLYHCGLPSCLVCGLRVDYADLMRRTLDSMERWREREAERLRRLYPQPSPLQRVVEEIEARRATR